MERFSDRERWAFAIGLAAGIVLTLLGCGLWLLQLWAGLQVVG